MMENRKELIMRMIPKDVESVLDIGSRGNLFRKDYQVVTIDGVEDAEVMQDLNIKQKLDFEDKSFDIVILNQILEHLNYNEELIREVKRVCKKYIFVGLPNEAVYSLRIKFLFGIIEQAGYKPYGHKHRFGIKEIENFVDEFFGEYEKKIYFGAFFGARILPKKVVRFLANLIPSLFAKEVYYLVEVPK